MLINVRVKDNKHALEFINGVLSDLEKEKTEDIHYQDDDIKITPEIRTEHVSEGPKDITIEDYMLLSIAVKDLDFKTQEVIKRHKGMLYRL